MAPKRPVSSANTPSKSPTTASAGASTASTTSSAGVSKATPNAITQPHTAQEIVLSVWDKYWTTTSQQFKLVDAFMAFLVLVGGLQFLYVILAGNYPFNAFLSGFSATVGQFVLTASLRMQTNPANKKEFERISNER
ncbi:MAG: hypothetical protein M1819_001869 [Sarea resinae]|nr:MAG: hypothetical protein M1819_001869 [Sarea resinae]